MKNWKMCESRGVSLDNLIMNNSIKRACKLFTKKVCQARYYQKEAKRIRAIIPKSERRREESLGRWKWYGIIYDDKKCWCINFNMMV